MIQMVTIGIVFTAANVKSERTLMQNLRQKCDTFSLHYPNLIFICTFILFYAYFDTHVLNVGRNNMIY